jgi:hypothetical protein
MRYVTPDEVRVMALKISDACGDADTAVVITALMWLLLMSIKHTRGEVAAKEVKPHMDAISEVFNRPQVN